MKQDKTEWTPQLRFPEFRESPGWEAVSLAEVSVPVTERVGTKKLTPVSISAGVGFVAQSAKFGRDISGNQYQLYTLVKDGDFVYNKGNSLKFVQGCIYLLQGWGEVAAPNVFICFRLKEGYSNGFFQNCFEKNIHGEQLKKHITSGARSNGLLNISRSDFFGIQIPAPAPAEQQKIAECLSSLDELIAAHAKELDALKRYKKGLMQQMFPREGETQPRLRFPEFLGDGDWSRGQTKDIAEVLQGSGFPEKHQGHKKGEFPFYKVSDISNSLASGEHFIAASANYIDTDTVKALRAKLIPKGTTVFAKIGEAIRSNKRVLTTMPCLVDNNVAGIKAHKGRAVDLFIYYLWTTISLSEHAGGVVPAVTKSTIEKIQIAFPNINEQQKVADCLSSLDQRISAQTQQLDALKTHKKGLMQRLFPSPQAVKA